jgi:prepilin-type N-terminal cleavage/methylation domain-containing protein
MLRSHRSGFTIIEILVVIVIMAILLGLTVVNMAGQQVLARDNERKQDAENIARGLERYYNEVAKPSVGKIGRYPDIATATNDIVQNNVLPGIEHSNLYFSFNDGTTSSFKSITDLTGNTPAEEPAATAAITALLNADTIVYVPMRWNGSLWEVCGSDEECTRFALYYFTEKDSVKHVIMSKQQQLQLLAIKASRS